MTREEGTSDVFNYNEMFCNTQRQHGHNDGLSPVEFERKQLQVGSAVSTETGAIHDYGVVKMTFGKMKDPNTGKNINDRSTVIYNTQITLEDIPEAA